MAKAYWVSVYREINDHRKLAAYDQLARSAVGAGGGRVLTRDRRVQAYEAGRTERVILIEFDSFEDAVSTYASPAYQRALETLGGGAERDFRIVEGLG